MGEVSGLLGELPQELYSFKPARFFQEPSSPVGEKVSFDGGLVEGTTAAFLLDRFDFPTPIQPFHRVAWALCASSQARVVIAAPRGHGKSTTVTHAFVLCALLFRFRDYVLIISDTEAQAASFIHDIKEELYENELLRTAFRVGDFDKETETDIIVSMTDGYKFRVCGKGAEQKVRGLKWSTKRPNLIVVDDLESDEMVMSQDRREKLLRWFLNALLPCGSDRCLYRMVGTVIHQDSLLAKLLEDPSWCSLCLDSHSDDYSAILWRDKFPPDRLKSLYEIYESQGNTEGYMMEYRNKVSDPKTSYFRKDCFLESSVTEPGRRPLMEYYVGADLAISLKQKADYTVFVVVGIDPAGVLHVVDIRRGRWDSYDIISELLNVQQTYRPELVAIDHGVISQAIGPFLYESMRKSGIYVNLYEIRPSKDKTVLARSWQARMRSKSVCYNKEADWWPDLYKEMSLFPRVTHDDQVDALAYVGLMLDELVPAMTAEEEEDEFYQYEIRKSGAESGRSRVTGY